MVAIKKRPTSKVSSLSAPVRQGGGSLVMKTTWKYPTAVTSTSSDKRATGTIIRTGLEGKVGGKAYYLKQDVKAGLVTEVQRSLAGTVIGSKTWTRSDFYPFTSRTLDLFWTHVKLRNDKGEGPWQSVKRKFDKPRKPSISAIQQDAQTGVLSCVITTDPGNDYRERRRTRYIVDVYDGTTGGTTTTDTSSGSTEFTVSRDIVNRMRLNYDQYARMRVRACAQGFAGDSDWAERNYYLSWPPLPVITGISVPSIESSGKVTVCVNLKSNDAERSADWNSTYNTQHPVTGCRLEILTDSEATTPEEATADDGWQALEYEDNGGCTALAATVADFSLDRGYHAWVRVKSWNDIEEIFYRYSAPVEVSRLHLAPPGQSESGIDIISAVSGDDGKSAVLTIGWNASGQDSMTGTEVSWSDDTNAWRSTAGPSTHEFKWSDGQLTVGQTTYQDSAVLHVSGLSEGTLYHFRARRYQDRDTGDRLYGEYAQNDMTAVPATSPTSVTLHVSGSVAEGRPLEASWSYDSDAMQTAYELITGDVTTETDPEDRDTIWIDDDGLGIIASGTDARGSYVIPADVLAEMATDGSIALAVRVSTGGAFVASQAVVVSIETPPVASVTVSDIDEQPATIALACNVSTAYCVVEVTSQGADGSLPDGSIAQVAGDVVWSGTVTPEWVTETVGYSATITLPDNLALYDGASYDVRLTPIDSVTGLQGQAVTASFSVEWEHQAPAPSESIVVTGSSVTDSDGVHTISASIALAAPTGAAQTDVYDVYRVLDDGVQLIAEGRGLTDTVVDPYAPFGNRTLAYRVALRTADGDLDWNDYGYTLLPRPVTDGLMMRIDFGSSYIELGRVTYGDKRNKSFSAREHLGSKLSEGYWGEQVSREASAAAASVMVYEQADIELMDALSVYNGPCFVRMSSGIAYEANVSVSGVNMTSRSAGVSYTLAITQVDLTDDYMAASVAVEESDEDELG